MGSDAFSARMSFFPRWKRSGARDEFAFLAFGMNVDDRGEHRPGQQAAKNHHVLAPLETAELHKSEIRELARQAGLALHAKPASACLASRLAYGLPVTAERLLQVEHAEEALHALGFGRVRVRHHDSLARVEFDRKEMPRALTMEMMDRVGLTLKALGFTYVAIDAEGYRSGSMNAVLPIAQIGRARFLNRSALLELLAGVERGEVSAESAAQRLKDLPFEDIGEARIDHHRALRHGLPE